MGTLFEKVI